jgi:hypothetical protein
MTIRNDIQRLVREINAGHRAAAESAINQFDFQRVAEPARERLVEQLADIVAGFRNELSRRLGHQHAPTCRCLTVTRATSGDTDMSMEKLNMERHAKRTPPTPAQIRAEQIRQAEADTARAQANLPAPAPAPPTTVAVPDNRTAMEIYADEAAPVAMENPFKFNPKGNPDYWNFNGEAIPDEDYTALCDELAIAYVRFNGPGNPPTRILGRPADNFVLPPPETLPERDRAQWPLFNGELEDPYQRHDYLPLQRISTREIYTFCAQSKTQRGAIGNLIRYYNRAQKQKETAGTYPVIRLRVSIRQHSDSRIGSYRIPVLAVVGKADKDSAAKPDTSISTDMNDQIPF